MFGPRAHPERCGEEDSSPIGFLVLWLLCTLVVGIGYGLIRVLF